MIIWSGWGILAALIPFFVSLMTEYMVETASGDNQLYQTQKLPLFFALLISAGILYLVSKKLQKSPARVVIDKKTGKEFTLAQKNSFFFIDLHYWPYIWIAVGVFTLLWHF